MQDVIFCYSMLRSMVNDDQHFFWNLFEKNPDLPGKEKLFELSLNGTEIQ